MDKYKSENFGYFYTIIHWLIIATNQLDLIATPEYYNVSIIVQ